jgi:hypothetical protein
MASHSLVQKRCVSERILLPGEVAQSTLGGGNNKETVPRSSHFNTTLFSPRRHDNTLLNNFRLSPDSLHSNKQIGTQYYSEQ